MTGESCGNVQIYENNPDKVRMVVYGNNEARALLWNTDEGSVVMDRIYPCDGIHVNFLHNWAGENGYVYRVNTSSNGGIGLSDGNSYHITLRHRGVFPYMDTFRYCEISERKVIVSNNYSFGNVILEDTCGGTSESAYCIDCEERIDRDDCCTSPGGDTYCEVCFSAIYTYCDRCESCISRDDVITVNDDQSWCDHCADNHANSCYVCSKYYEHGGIFAEDTNNYYCEECAQDELDICFDCGCYFENLTECDDEEYRCDKCAAKYEESSKVHAVA